MSVLAEILTVEQLAQVIHKSPTSIRSDASRNPGALPPICRLPGNKRLLWRREDVLAWIAKHVQGPAGQQLGGLFEKTPQTKRRGRPRKTSAYGESRT